MNLNEEEHPSFSNFKSLSPLRNWEGIDELLCMKRHIAFHSLTVKATKTKLLISCRNSMKNDLPFSRRYVILHLAVSVGTSVRRYVTNTSEFRAVLALRPLPNRPRLSCRVSGLVLTICIARSLDILS